jgi:hypothetical protein
MQCSDVSLRLPHDRYVLRRTPWAPAPLTLNHTGHCACKGATFRIVKRLGRLDFGGSTRFSEQTVWLADSQLPYWSGSSLLGRSWDCFLALLMYLRLRVSIAQPA